MKAFGFSRVEVVDEDLDRSTAGVVARVGFERMVAEVCLGKVGAVAARGVSRFARNSRGWQQLVEMCRVVDTLLIDQDTVYAPRQSNDRLLLGLKGNPYVIVGAKDGAYLMDLQKPWRRVRKATELEDVRIQDLRHTFAPEAVMGGKSLRW